MGRREAGTRVRRAAPLPKGAAAPFVIVTEAQVPGAPTEWRPHAHPAHELVCVRRGAVTARVGDRVFTVSEGCGLWMPAGEVHAGRLTAKAELRTAFFAPDRTPVAFAGPTAVAVTPLLESLLAHLARPDIDAGARARAEAVVFDVLEPARRPLALGMPGDARADVVAEALLRDPADDRSLEEWARDLDVSPRTISRAFRAATGLSFAQWRRSLRIHRALALLGEGCEVQDVAERLGYAQTSTPGCTASTAAARCWTAATAARNARSPCSARAASRARSCCSRSPGPPRTAWRSATSWRSAATRTGAASAGSPPRTGARSSTR